MTRSVYAFVQCGVSTGGLLASVIGVALVAAALGAVEMISYDAGFPGGALTGSIRWVHGRVIAPFLRFWVVVHGSLFFGLLFVASGTLLLRSVAVEYEARSWADNAAERGFFFTISERADGEAPRTCGRSERTSRRVPPRPFRRFPHIRSSPRPEKSSEKYPRSDQLAGVP